MPTYRPHFYNALCTCVMLITKAADSAGLRALHDSPEPCWSPRYLTCPRAGEPSRCPSHILSHRLRKLQPCKCIDQLHNSLIITPVVSVLCRTSPISHTYLDVFRVRKVSLQTR